MAIIDSAHFLHALLEFISLGTPSIFQPISYSIQVFFYTSIFMHMYDYCSLWFLEIYDYILSI